MQSPTTADLRAAIQVLEKLNERLNKQAAHSVIQLPETRLGDDYAARIESRALEQTAQIEAIAAQLKIWRDELLQHRRLSIHV